MIYLIMIYQVLLDVAEGLQLTQRSPNETVQVLVERTQPIIDMMALPQRVSWCILGSVYNIIPQMKGHATIFVAGRVASYIVSRS